MYIIIACLLLIAQVSIAQLIPLATYQQHYQLPIGAKKSPIKVDGNLDEAAWSIPIGAEHFWMKFPTDDTFAKSNTTVKMCYDETNIYFAITVQDVKPYIGQSLKRDSRIRENDGVSIILDPINKKTNGYYFSVTAYNVQADDVMGGGDDDLTFSWDAKWYSATKHYEKFYTIEIAIPFKAIRYNDHNTTWGINFIRSNKKANEFNTWTRIPVNFRGTNIGYLGALKWDKAPPNNGKNMVLIPYLNQSTSTNNVANTPLQATLNAGLDAKIALTNALNVDLTINPDFSQVEVDRQVTNLSRFSIFFPERRNFFLENSDLYSNFGIEPIRPFYSRTIGLDAAGNSVPIIAGVRVSGNVTNKMRIGLLNMHTKATTNYAAQNYTAATVQQQVLKRSVIKTYFLNRTAFYTKKNKKENELDAYGRNAGAELSYSNNSGTNAAWLGVHHAIKPTINNRNNYFNYGTEYSTRTFNALVNVDHVGVNYYTDMGFVERISSFFGNTDSVVRNGFKSAYSEVSYSIFPKHSQRINQHRITLENFYVLNTNNTFNEWNTELRYNINFKHASTIQVAIEHNSIALQVPLAFTKGIPLPVATYNYAQVRASYESDNRKNFVYGLGIRSGTFYNGTYTQYNGKVILRKQPKYTVELIGEFNQVTLPQPYTSANLLLIAPRIEVNFTNNLFWTTFIQYNTQRNNLNFNSRLQWRYKPASDLFVVYTDNYFTDPLFRNKNRALVLKANYWLNL